MVFKLNIFVILTERGLSLVFFSMREFVCNDTRWKGKKINIEMIFLRMEGVTIHIYMLDYETMEILFLF
jgi:hypothetical protein